MISSNSKTTNVLLTLGILFAASSVVRFIPFSSTAEAATETKSVATDEASPFLTSDKAAANAVNSAPMSDQTCLASTSIESMRSDLDYLETLRTELTQAKLDIELERAELDTRAAELEDLERQITQRWEQMQSVSNEDLTHLAKMYGSMKPTQAAEIFDKMDPAFAAGFLRMISSDQAGLVLAEMDSSKAYMVSVEMANRNADLRRD